MTQISMAGMSAVALLMAACSGPSEETPAQGAELSGDKAVPAAEAPAPDASKDAAENVAAEKVDALQLIKLDCGSIYVSDLDVFSTAGDYTGQTDTLTDTCWLVRHPDGNLLWDLGLPGALAGQDDQTQGIYTVSMARKIADQLADMGLAMSDIDMVAISHSHFDHVGQAGDIDPSTVWLVNDAEYAFMFPEGDAAREDAQAVGQFEDFETLKHQTISDNYDVFGDGSVVIFQTPGHTPGHSSLLVRLPETGPVLLTGDLYHRKESRELGRVPQFNTDDETTRASMKAFEAKADELVANIIIQHEPADTDGLPKIMK